MKWIVLICYLCFSTVFFGQNRVLPIGSYFRDQSFPTTNSFNPVFPVTNNQVQYFERVKDSAKRYSQFGYVLYNRELIVLKKDEGTIWITPLIDLSLGKTLNDTSAHRSQNTRGVRVEGILGKNFFFTTSFYENQAVFPEYISNYIEQRGEFYLNTTDSTYYQQNAVVPGAARTKPFKTEGYDYAYATGMIQWQMTPKLSASWGNQSLFVGSGYRSMLWSDNSVAAMNLRVRYAFSSRWELQLVKMRGLNLLRRPYTNNGEAYYEPKSLSFSTLYFHPSRTTSIGIFEGGIWNRGDSIRKTTIQGAYFIPIPGGATLQEAIGKDAYSLVGIDANARFDQWMIYGQIGTNFFTSGSMITQLGVRIYPLKNPLNFLQLEYNHADDFAYTAQSPRIHYTNYNLPLAHPMGRGLDELILRFNYEWNHWFCSGTTAYYFKQATDYTALLPLYQTSSNTASQSVLNQLIEIGYRFNRSYGFEVLGSFRYRNALANGQHSEGAWINLGIRTGLTNHYYDF